jgi:predicted amidohydrolase
MLLYLPRFYVRDLQTNLVEMVRHLHAAARAGCELIVFPEQFLTGYHAPAEPRQLHDAFAEASAPFPQLLCVFGTISEEGHNRLWAYRGGQPLAHYDKVHLFTPNGEDQWWTPGGRYVALHSREWTFGLLTCNDVRFCEQSRALALRHGVNALLYPALWPWERDHVWRALLQARAIENGAFSIGCCVAGVDNGYERFDGAGNYVFDPLGVPVYPRSGVHELELARLSQVTLDTCAHYREIAQVELVEA